MVAAALGAYVKEYLDNAEPKMHIFYLPVYFPNATREYQPSPFTDDEKKAFETDNKLLGMSEKLMKILGGVTQNLCRPNEFDEKSSQIYLASDYIQRVGGYFDSIKRSASAKLPQNHLRILDQRCPGQNVYLTLYFVDYPGGSKKSSTHKKNHTTLYKATRAFFAQVKDVEGIGARAILHNEEPKRKQLANPWLVSFTLWSIHQYVTPNEISEGIQKRVGDDDEEEEEEIFSFTLPTMEFTFLNPKENATTTRRFDNKSGKLICHKPSELIAICTSETLRKEFGNQLRDFATFAIVDYYYSLLTLSLDYNKNGYILNVLALPNPLTATTEEKAVFHPTTKAVQLYLKMGYRVMYAHHINQRGTSVEKNPFYMYRGPLTLSEVKKWIRDLRRRSEIRDFYDSFIRYIRSVN